MKMKDNQKNLEQDLSDVDFDDTPDHGHRDLLEQKLLLNFNAPSARHNMKWRTIMNNKITKLAIAAVIAVAVLAGINIVNYTGSVALAHVLDKIMEIRVYAYRMQTTSADVSDYTEFQILTSKDYGQRSTSYVPDQASGQLELFTTTYANYSQGVMTSVIARNKIYVNIDIDDDVLAGIRKETGNPSFFLSEFLKQPYIELGRDNIDGIEVVGFESTDMTDQQGRSVARMWIDIASELPVRIETETFAQDGSLVSKMTVYDFDWAPQVAQSDFEPVIPDGYQNVDFGKVDFAANESSVIQAMAFYAKIFDGKYPETLAVKTLTLSTQIEDVLKSGAGAMYEGMPQEEIMKEVGQGCMNLEFSTIFFGMLASENKAVAYYGDKVTADTPNAVLMRWRQDDGRYMVIFGNLTSKRVSEEALAELEAMPLLEKVEP
jgi:hypothetical protein